MWPRVPQLAILNAYDKIFWKYYIKNGGKKQTKQRTDANPNMLELSDKNSKAANKIILCQVNTSETNVKIEFLAEDIN